MDDDLAVGEERLVRDREVDPVRIVDELTLRRALLDHDIAYIHAARDCRRTEG